MSERLRVCVVGCGQIAEAHLAAFAELYDQVELVCTVDSEESRAQAAAAKYNARRWSTDYHEAFAAEDTDAAILCLPHHLHAPIAIAAANAGLHVLCEKPMALNTQEAADMVQAARRSETRLMIGHSRRFTPRAMAAKRIVADGELGPLRHVSSHLLTRIERPSTDWRYSSSQTGGFMIPIFGTHLIDLLTWVTESRVKRVYCQVSANSVWEGEDEVTTILTLLTADGMTLPATVQISAHCRFHPKQRGGRDELIVAGSEKTLTLTRNGLHLNSEAVNEEEKEGLSNFAMQLSEFLTAVREDREPISSGVEALYVMAVLDACHESAATGEAVSVEIPGHRLAGGESIA